MRKLAKTSRCRWLVQSKGIFQIALDSAWSAGATPATEATMWGGWGRCGGDGWIVELVLLWVEGGFGIRRILRVGGTEIGRGAGMLVGERGSGVGPFAVAVAVAVTVSVAFSVAFAVAFAVMVVDSATTRRSGGGWCRGWGWLMTGGASA